MLQSILSSVWLQMCRMPDVFSLTMLLTMSRRWFTYSAAGSKSVEEKRNSKDRGSVGEKTGCSCFDLIWATRIRDRLAG